jgi:hypothetical protein
MDWCRYYCVYGASSVAIDPSRWQVLLVSLFSNTFAGEEMQLHLSLSYYFYSLTTDINRVSQNPRVPAAHGGMLNSSPGVRVHYFLLLAVC